MLIHVLVQTLNVLTMEMELEHVLAPLVLFHLLVAMQKMDALVSFTIIYFGLLIGESFPGF